MIRESKVIRSKQFTQEIIDTLGTRIHELVLPFPKSRAKQNEIIENVKSVFSCKNEAKDIVRSTLLNVTPVHGFEDEGNYLTLM